MPPGLLGVPSRLCNVLSDEAIWLRSLAQWMRGVVLIEFLVARNATHRVTTGPQLQPSAVEDSFLPFMSGAYQEHKSASFQGLKDDAVISRSCNNDRHVRRLRSERQPRQALQPRAEGTEAKDCAFELATSSTEASSDGTEEKSQVSILRVAPSRHSFAHARKVYSILRAESFL